jgi:hypothetical protein
MRRDHMRRDHMRRDHVDGPGRYLVGDGILSWSPGLIVLPPLRYGFICRTVARSTPKKVTMPERVSATFDPLPAGAGPGPRTVYT